MSYLPALFLALIGFLVIIRYRQAILLFMGVEILLASGNWIALLAIDHEAITTHAAIFILFSIAVAAAEATIGLSIVLRLAERHRTTEIRAFESLKDGEG